MDRSNPTSSRQGSIEPFGYQTRLLERTSSLSRSSSQRGIHGSSAASTGTTPRRWNPTHRVANSIDSARGIWEERARAESDAQSTGSSPRTSSNSASTSASTQSNATRSDSFSDAHSLMKLSNSFQSPPTPYRKLDDSAPPPTASPLLKRHTLPAPIITFPPPRGSAGVTTESPEASPMLGSASRHRLHIPVSSQIHTMSSMATRGSGRSSPSVSQERVDSHTPISSRSRRSVDFDSIMANTVTIKTPTAVESAIPTHVPKSYDRQPLSPNGVSRLPTFSSLSTPSLTSPDKQADASGSSLGTPPSPDRPSGRYYRPPPPSPSSSVMSPAPYRSSYMANKKAATYGDTLGIGRRLGRHLPRIASGDGNDDNWGEDKDKLEQQRTPEEKAKVSRLERREKRLQEWERDMAATPTPSRSKNVIEGLIGAMTDTDDVAGVPGRLRLSKDTTLQVAPAPIPSSKISRGLWADTQRHLLQAYEYLCHVGEAQQWIEGCLGEELGFGIVEMEDGLRNGVVLAKLVRMFQGEAVVRRIYEAPKLDFRHSDNINYFFNFVRHVGLPDCFIFELTDLYNKKNLPKVIYCIHALSHLLARRGLAERIGNLVGQLKFSDDQLQQTDNGLKASGVAMPNFGNVGRELAKEINEEPEVEVETEDERRDRLLLENESSIIAMQAIARAFLIRKAQATQRGRMRLAERYLPRLQARCRGFLTRHRLDHLREEQADLGPWIVALQSRARALVAQRDWRAHQTRLHALQHSFVKIQSQSRGVLTRRRFEKLRVALTKSAVSVLKLQSLARARMSRKVYKQVHKTFEQPRTLEGVVALQSVARGALTRVRVQRHEESLRHVATSIVSLQAQVRGIIARRRLRTQLAKLDDVSEIVVRIQAAVRCYLARKRLLNLIRSLRRATPAIIGFQAKARANLKRIQHQDMNKTFSEVKLISSVGTLQALARAALVRRRHNEQQKRLDYFSPDFVGVQAAARGVLVRQDYISWRNHLRSSHADAARLQALLWGVLERRKFRAKIQYYRSNLDKVIKIQSLFRAKDTREQYRQLTLGKNVTVGTIKNFVHLLDDSEADFEDEIEVERLRKRVVESIRENQALENDVNELDVRIALVVQNVKSFEELVKARRRLGADSAAAHAARASVLAAHGDPFAGPNTLDHATKRKLELYQQLFYFLQTESVYLSRLFFILPRVDIPEKSKRLAERVVLTLFGYGQGGREEYLLLKLFQMAIDQDIAAALSINDVVRNHAMYVDVAVQYLRPKQVVYVRETLQIIIKEVIEQDELDLETDPCVIYRSRINAEEMRTGRKSTKSKDISFYEAVEDPETRTEYIHHLQRLHALTKGFVNAITNSTRKMPYGMRCMAREILHALRLKFPDVSEETYAACIGKLVYYRYINPAIVTPETFDIVPTTIGIAARKNLAEISKMLTQITSGVAFGEENPRLTPLNSYVEEAIRAMGHWFIEVADVPDAEAQFHAHEFLDVTAQPKPIYISPNEVYSMHTLLSQHLEHIAPSRDDPLRVILLELGGVPNLGTDELKDARDRAITLELTNRFANVKDPHAEEKALWVQSKRAVLAILRVQPAKDLVESLMQPVSDEHELFWEDIVDREMMTDRMRQRRRRMPSATGAESAYRLEDVQSLNFREVKAHAIFFLLELEKRGKVNRTDGYQGILNAIAGDVRSKHRKRLQRQRELESMHEALAHLAERKKYFEEQISSYHNYVEAAMNTMQRGKSKKRFVMPFTKQYFHLRDLQRSGKPPQFGSFRYSAQDLYDKGILLSIDQFSPRQFDRVDLVLSSNKAGVFHIEVYNTALGASTLIAETELRVEELLQAQFENRVSLALFDGIAKFNLNLLLYQINKKFYV